MSQQSAGGRRNPVRPKRLASLPTFPRGPKFLDFASLPKVGGYGEPPPGFISPSNSQAEWPPFWGLGKIFGVPKNPRRGPFIGFPGIWEYQVPFQGGATPGGTHIDFVVYPHELTRGRPIALRIVTERFHLNVDPRKRAKDMVQEAALSTSYVVVDIYEQNFLFDRSGQTIIKLLKHVLAGGRAPDPFAGGRGDIRIRDRNLS